MRRAKPQDVVTASALQPVQHQAKVRQVVKASNLRPVASPSPRPTSPDSRRWPSMGHPVRRGRKRAQRSLRRYFPIGHIVSQAQLGIFSISGREMISDVYICESVSDPWLSNQ
ncbi:hypothetical protein SUVC_12G4460 [Saccharomyces uvarum]|uniref:Uncharacterized protein n=1 Tax=Saccharomyces uvarum TaxID=230603 RepID=A0AA35J4U7_SACUV|nr:hypothetical protein SUVC_12G4460 [Saccharomyces uvarum]